jgi:hypothetical protein
MNLALWVAQGVLALVMLGAGSFKLVTPHDRLAQKLKWVVSWPPGRVKLLGAAEVSGAFGVVVPWVTGIGAILTPVAACCLLVLMGGAMKVHVDLKESPAPPAIVGAVCAFVALGRFGALG